MERKFVFSEGEYYHVYNRGVERRDIFHDDPDRLRFHRMLHIANSTNPVVYKLIQRSPLDEIKIGERLVAIGAYCLMPNHFHLLLKEITEGGISKFMEKLTTAYSKYYNKKHNHSGVLFQGRFKAEHVDNDEYLKYLFAYIHLNPVKLIEPRWRDDGIENSKAAKSYLSDYKHSSYLDYAKEHTGVSREELTILSREEFPEYFAEPRDFQDFVNDWLQFREEAQIGGRVLTRSIASK